MDENAIRGKWDQLKGDLQKRWGKLTNDDLAQVNGEENRLIGILEEKYGMTEDEARRELNDWTI